MDILDIPEAEKEFWSSLIDDYHIRVIHMLGQPEEVRKKYRSDYGVIADYLAYYKDRDALKTYWKKEERSLIHVEQVLDMLQAFSSDTRFATIKKRYSELEDREACNKMCLLLDMCEESGIKKGMEKGMEKGIEKGIEKLAALLVLLKSMDRVEDANKVIFDSAYREELFKEFNL